MSSIPNHRDGSGRFPVFYRGPRFSEAELSHDDPDERFRRAISNLDAEKAVLSACLSPDSSVEERQAIYSLLEPEDFFRDAHAELYRAIRAIEDDGTRCDNVILCDRLEALGIIDQVGGDDYIGEVANFAPHSANGPHHAAIVKGKSKTRKLQVASAGLVQDIQSQAFSANDLLDRFATTIQRIEQEASREEEDDASSFHPWPDAPDPAVWHGVAGQLVRAIEPFTEADPMAILGQILVSVGNLVGRTPHWRYERTKHGLNLFLCVVGATSEARKGSSWNHVLDLMNQVDGEWVSRRILSGLSTGEGLIHQVRDPVFKTIHDPDTGAVVEKEIDAGVDDKRVLFVESEFGGLLTTMSRDGYNTSAVIRQAWDGGNLRVSNKNTPSNATGAHVSIIGHITAKELREKLTSTESANGFGNRFIWLCAKRSKILPHGGDVDSLDLSEFVLELQEVAHHIKFVLRPDVPIRRDAAANRLWEQEYLRLTSGKQGLVGDLTARAAPNVMRIASLYAVLDRSITVQEHHLRAALAFWTYCEQSAAWLFGDYVCDPEGQALLKALQESPDGLTRTQINRKAFKGHKTADDLNRLLHRMVKDGQIEPPPKTSPDDPSMRSVRGALWTLKKKNVPGVARFAC